MRLKPRSSLFKPRNEIGETKTHKYLLLRQKIAILLISEHISLFFICVSAPCYRDGHESHSWSQHLRRRVGLSILLIRFLPSGPLYDLPLTGPYSILSLKNKAALERENITHVVSVLRLSPTEELFSNFQHHRIDVDDVDYENLLEHLPAAVKFIQSGLDSNGGVLVHW
jgi:hypothetical protein